MPPKPAEFKVRVTEGSRMRAYQSNMLILELAAAGETGSARVELFQSEQYEIASPNPLIVEGFESGPRKATFIIRPNNTGSITLNFKIGDMTKTYYISAQTENPYIFGEPVRDQQLFFGRVAELSEVYRGVTKRNKQNYLITGPRRVGKTSLLLQLNARLQYPFISLMLTPEKMGHEHHQMFRAIVLQLRGKAAEILDQDLPPLDWDVKSATADTPIDLFNYHLERDLEKCLDRLGHINEETRVILLFDEANFLLTDALAAKTAHDSRQEFLRYLLQTYDRIACVLVGTPQILRMTSVTSPLYNIFSGIKLKGLSQQETEMLIREPAHQVNVRFEDDAVTRIIAYGGCSPYYTQALCSLALERMYETTQGSSDSEDTLTVLTTHVDTAIGRVLDTIDYGLRSLWEALEPDERAVLECMGSGPVVVDQHNRETISRLAEMNLVNVVPRDVGTPSEKTFASIKAQLDEEWIRRQGR